MYITAAVVVILVLLYFFVFRKRLGGQNMSMLDPNSINKFDINKWECSDTAAGFTCKLKSDPKTTVNLHREWTCVQKGNSVECTINGKSPTKINMM
jgi:hypothetical protein